MVPTSKKTDNMLKQIRIAFLIPIGVKHLTTHTATSKMYYVQRNTIVFNFNKFMCCVQK